jgi:hypothetical protein
MKFSDEVVERKFSLSLSQNILNHLPVDVR